MDSYSLCIIDARYSATSLWLRNEYVDLVEAGIIDATKVLRIALENAVSVASVLLLTEATMTEMAETTKEHPTTPEMPY